MIQGQFYFITDEFYNIYDKDKKLMQNKEKIDGVDKNRPCFYAFPDKTNPKIYWCVPISSKVDKYKRIYEKKIEKQQRRGIKNPKCNTIRFGEVMGRETAFLIQNVFPITKEYIAGVYLNKATNSAVRIPKLLEADIITNATLVLKLVFHGNANLVFSDVISTYNSLCTVEFIVLDMQDKTMLMALLPLYQTYEAEISKEELDEFYPADSFDGLFTYFKAYFEGKTTYICVVNGAYKGFVSFHLVCDEMPGYADGYEGWGHMSEIYIEKQSRGLGLGKMLVYKAEAGLKKHDIKGIYLTDIADNGLFWEALDYIDTGKIEPNEGGRIYEKENL